MEKEVVRDAINAFYKGAGVNKKFTGSVNDKVANIFGKMLIETRKCSNALAWVPTPPGGRATITWFATNFGRAMLDRFRDSVSLTCARQVIHVWSRELDRASILG
ncbi:hypothetical protein DXX93_11115 [Thalassotalea euphylliae]|uniref:Uncharacterized protein n=1 Tax=Thalassotalea euphylliae TaxID=1655234 RepID=A0A3E0TRD8_9GAMM|nr:hypothetical protein [Thalassotalea euphylliae]REL27058.1 hypothetical protein DXX93_11115 [Thalassotalea euphylliae]